MSVTVKATDQGDPSLEGVCSFTVEITDVNDNPPLFDRQVYIYIYIVHFSFSIIMFTILGIDFQIRVLILVVSCRNSNNMSSWSVLILLEKRDVLICLYTLVLNAASLCIVQEVKAKPIV